MLKPFLKGGGLEELKSTMSRISSLLIYYINSLEGTILIEIKILKYFLIDTPFYHFLIANTCLTIYTELTNRKSNTQKGLWMGKYKSIVRNFD